MVFWTYTALGGGSTEGAGQQPAAGQSFSSTRVSHPPTLGGGDRRPAPVPLPPRLYELLFSRFPLQLSPPDTFVLITLPAAAVVSPPLRSLAADPRRRRDLPAQKQDTRSLKYDTL